jgi:uncharacterized protein involved in exopolysaccharide biosynthesis
MQPHSPVPRRAPVDAGGDALLDVEHARQLLGFVGRSVRRHRALTAAIFGSVAAVTGLAFALLPRTYETQTKILAQRNFVMPALGNPKRTVPLESDAPTRLAAEAVMSRENLVAIIKQTNLLDEWRATRPLVLRLKDRVVSLVAGPPSEAEQLDALVGTLERRLWVVSDEETVAIGVRWPDANTAFLLVQSAQRNFLEGRHASEVATIGESIGILEGHATEVQARIEASYAELRRQAPAAPAAPPPAPGRRTATDDDVASLRAMLAARRLAIADLEEFQRRRLATLEAQLGEQKNSYGSAHPAIAATQRSIAELSVESPQLTQLRRTERDLVAQLRLRGADPSAAAAPASGGSIDQSFARAALASMERARNDSTRAERESYIRARIKMSEGEYQDLLERLEGARIELETARAAFKYRYGVVSPASSGPAPAASCSPRCWRCSWRSR